MSLGLSAPKQKSLKDAELKEHLQRLRQTDNVTNWITKWGVAVNNPSPPLLWPGTTHVYVGGGDGRLHEIDTQTAAHKTLALDYDPVTFVVGAPSLDIGFRLVHVGSERGTFYAVRVPLP